MLFDRCGSTSNGKERHPKTYYCFGQPQSFINNICLPSCFVFNTCQQNVYGTEKIEDHKYSIFLMRVEMGSNDLLDYQRIFDNYESKL